MLISETYEQHLRRRIILHLRIFFADQAKPQEGEELGGVNRPDKSDLTGGLIVALIRRIKRGLGIAPRSLCSRVCGTKSSILALDYSWYFGIKTRPIFPFQQPARAIFGRW
jgi:hypothetical protein